MVFPLRGGPARVWSAPSHLADLADPDMGQQHHPRRSCGSTTSRTSNRHGHLATRTQERLLDTTASGHDLLSSQVLTTASGPRAFLLGSADLTHGGSQIVASAARNVPFTGTPGTAVIRLETISAATGKVIKVLATRTVHYGTASARSQADSSLQVLGLDASGRYALVYAPRFGILSGGVFTPLKSGPGIAYAAAW